MRSTKMDRPRKRQGNLGDDRARGGRAGMQNKKTTMFRQVGQKKGNDKRQFTR